MPRRTTVIIATLAPIGCLLHLVVVLLLIGLAWAAWSCRILRTETAVSPDGLYVARYQSEGCGGATGDVRRWVDLRSTTDGRGVRLLSSGYSDDLLDGLKLTWADERTLLVQYQYEESSASLKRPIDLGSSAWRGVIIKYQEIPFSERCGIYHAKGVMSPDGKYRAFYELEVCDPVMGDPQRIWYDRGESEAVIHKPDSPHDIAVVLAGGPGGHVYLITSSELPHEFQLKWADNRTLIVEYQGWDVPPVVMDRSPRSWSDVTIKYEEVPLPSLPGMLP